jgi:hypothetical protein
LFTECASASAFSSFCSSEGAYRCDTQLSRTSELSHADYREGVTFEVCHPAASASASILVKLERDYWGNSVESTFVARGPDSGVIMWDAVWPFFATYTTSISSSTGGYMFRAAWY